MEELYGYIIIITIITIIIARSFVRRRFLNRGSIDSNNA